MTRPKTNENDFADDADENNDDGFEEYRTIADALDGNLDESMFLAMSSLIPTKRQPIKNASTLLLVMHSSVQLKRNSVPRRYPRELPRASATR